MGLFSNRGNNDYAQPRALGTHRSLVASAQRVNIEKKDEIEQLKKRKAGDVWQTEAWEYFDAIGEIKYAGGLVGAVISRCRLYPGYSIDPDTVAAHVNDAARDDTVQLPEGFAHDCDRILRRLDSANGGISGLLSRAAINLWTAGECYLVQEPKQFGSDVPERWDIKSIDELLVGSDGKLSLKSSRYTQQGKVLPSEAFAGRIWRPHPRYSDEADSSLRAVRDLCDELLLLNRTAKATARSRLNAGAMFVPDGLSVAKDPDVEPVLDEDDNQIIDIGEEEDSFEQELIDAMTTPISDESSASAVVPLLIRGPADAGEKIKLFKFERSFDAALTERGDRVLERLLQGLDMPKDIVAGLAQVKYSNAVVIDDQLYKAHIEPLILLLCDALTAVYFRPSLRAMGYEEEFISKAVIWYDPTEILTRPDRAASANEGYDRKALSQDAWRRSHGYSDADAPTQDELVKRTALERGPITPEIMTALLKVMVPTLLNAVRDQSLADSPVAPLSPAAQNVINGKPPADGTNAGERPPANPTPQPSPGPKPPVPTTAVPVYPAPPTPTPVGVVP